MERLKLLTLNLWNKAGPWEQRLSLIRREIEALSPDVVGLQEVLRLHDDADRPVTDGDQLDELSRGLGYEAHFGVATELGGGLGFGNGLLTRHPVLETAVFPLPHEDHGQLRSVLYARIATPAGELPVFVTHLHWRLHHGRLRIDQVKALVSVVFDRAPIDESRLPPVVLADMNAEPDSDEMRFLRGLATLEGRSVYFADAWIYAGDGTPGHTFDRRNAFAALAHEPPRRIDYVLVRGPDTKLRGEPLGAQLVGTEPTILEDGSRCWPSDHFGVYAEIAAAPRE